MNTGIPHIPPDLHQKDLQLLDGPPEHAGEQRQAEAGKAADDVLEVPHAHLLVLGVLGPRVDGPLVHRLGDVDEAGLDELVLVLLGRVERPAQLLGRLVHVVAPSPAGFRGRAGVVVALHRVHGVEELYPAAGREVAASRLSLASGLGGR